MKRTDDLPRFPRFPRASETVLVCERSRDGGLPDRAREEERGVICESELRVVVNGEPLVNLLCSNSALAELAHGFLYNERVIDSLDEVLSFSLDRAAMQARFTVARDVPEHTCPTISSGFGGKALLPLEAEAGAPTPAPLSTATPAPAPATAPGQMPGPLAFRRREGRRGLDDVLSAMDAMNRSAREYRATRGMHCTALFLRGDLVASYEDVGRHNTLDKVSGRCLLEGVDTRGCLLATSGRISAEMMRKAVRMGASAVCSFSGPTDRAVALAREANVLLAGYANGKTATFYAGYEPLARTMRVDRPTAEAGARG